MPRTADRFASHLFGTPREPTVRTEQRVFVVRPRGASDSIKSAPVQVTVDRRKSTGPSLPGRTSRTSGSDVETGISSHPSTHRKSVVNVVEGEDGDVEIIMEENEPMVLTVLEETNMDGVRHLSDKNRGTRCTWLTLIAIFTFLALYQIFTQLSMYITTPVATNIEADYPTKIAFPTIAICNNNQFRLTYLTGARIQNRRTKNRTHSIRDIDENSTNVFDKALLNSWDMDALKFLRNAAHWKSRMILKCTWPNGTSCRMTDFKAVWTLTGLCWAINTDPLNPVFVTGAGSAHALRLLLNIERYERVESCTPKFRTTSLPGIKILIYNQTDIPITSLNGVNVPPGFTMDIPFYMKQRHKFPGFNCIQESKEHMNEFPLDFDNPYNTQTCLIRNYLAEIERQCACSMRRAYNPNPRGGIPFCNVDDYFSCVMPVLKWGYDGGFSTYNCMSSCEEIDYVAWQDMNELPNNIFPKLIDSMDDEDEMDVEASDSDLDMDEEVYEDLTKDEHYKCEHNQILEDGQVNRIKREAHRAYEKQARYQEDMLLRTKKLIMKMKQSAQKLNDLKWGWHHTNFKGVYLRLKENIDCYGNISLAHQDVFNAITNPAAHGEERRANQLVHLLDKNGRYGKIEELKTISDVKHAYGADRVEKLATQLQDIDEILDKLHSIYNEDTYRTKLSKDLEKVGRIIQLIDQFDTGKLQKRAWAEKMQSRNMRHFFDEDFYEDWYNVVTKDLDQNLVRTINDLEDQIEYLSNLTVNGTGLEMGSVLLFGDSEVKHVQIFASFLDDILNCTLGPVRNHSANLLKDFRKAMHDFQAAYTNLFKKELVEYLDNFEFGNKFVRENFGIVNVFLHKMNIEHWRQDATYSFWSMLCDVGGALGLFLGASLLTIIELIYLCFQYGFCRKSWDKVKGHPWVKRNTTKINIKTRKSIRKMSKRWGLRPRKRSEGTTSDDDKSDFEYETMLPLKDETEENENATNEKQEKLKKRQRKKAHFGLNLPIVVPGLLKSSFRKKPSKVEENIQSDTTPPFESSADDIDLTEIKLEEEERPEKVAQEMPKSQQESKPKQVAIPIESDDNIEKAPLQTKEPILEDKTRPLTPEIIIAQKEPTTSKETQESQGPIKTTQTPEAPQETQISETEIPQEAPEIPTEAMEIPQESPKDEEIPTTSRPRTKSSKTPSIQESPITDSQYSTDSLQAYSEPEMGMPDDSDPEFGAEPRQTLLAAIDSLLKDDLPDLSRTESAKKPENEPVVDKPVEGDKSIEPEKSSAQFPSSENEPLADRPTEEENLIKPEELKMETDQIPSPESPVASEQDRPSLNDPLAQSYQDQPSVDDSLTQPPGDVSGLKQEEAVETIDEPYNAPEQPVGQQESQDSSPILFDSGISDSKQPQHKVGLTPSTTTIPPESTPKLTDSGISEDKKLGQKDAPSTSSSITPMEASTSESVTPMEASTPEPVTLMEASTLEPKIGEKATEISTPAKEPTEIPIPAVASAPPGIEQQPPSSSSREPSAAPTDPREHRSKSQSSSLYPPSDPRQQSDSEPEFVPDPGPSSSRQRQKRRSSTPDLPTRKEQSNSEAYPIDRVMIEPPEAILKIEDSDTNTTSSSSGTNVPKLVFGPESKSVQKEGIEKEKEEEKQTIV